MSKDTRERLSLWVSSVIVYRLRSAYKKSCCRSMNELAEQAIDWLSRSAAQGIQQELLAEKSPHSFEDEDERRVCENWGRRK